MMSRLGAYGLSEDGLNDLVRQQAEVDVALQKFMEDEVVPYWRAVSPVRTGEYAASIKVTQDAKFGKGEVAATSWKAHLIEDGTPTSPEFAPAGKTAAHFGGTLDR